MKILLYGGTFDPPHNGHKNNLRAALERVRPDRAIVMPAGTPPHKHASATPAELRLQMCQCFRALSPAVEVSDWEIRQGGRSYTVHTLEMLRGANPGAELYLCVGSDMLLTFGEWYRWQDMLKMAALVVESRTGTDDAALHAAAAKLEPAGRYRRKSGRRFCRRKCWRLSGKINCMVPCRGRACPARSKKIITRSRAIEARPRAGHARPLPPRRGEYIAWITTKPGSL